MPPTPAFDRTAALLATYLFGDLTPAELEPLARSAPVRTLVRGEYVFHVGDPADALYVVVAGRLKDTVDTEDGEEVIYSIDLPGMVLGEPGFFAPERNRILGVVALEPSTVLVLERQNLLPFLERHPRVLMRLLERLATMARFGTEVIVTLARRPLAERLLLRLLVLAESGGDGRANGDSGEVVTPRVSQGDLAAMVGSSREHVNRGLAKLAADGLLRIEGNRYVITDPDRLRREMFPGWPLRVIPARTVPEPDEAPPGRDRV